MSDLTVRIISQEVVDVIGVLTAKLQTLHRNDIRGRDLIVSQLLETVDLLAEKNVVEDLAHCIIGYEDGLDSPWIVNIDGFEDFWSIPEDANEFTLVEEAKKRLSKLSDWTLIGIYSNFTRVGERGYRVDKFIWSHSVKVDKNEEEE